MIGFVKSERGYALTLGLVMLPAFILMTVLLVDLGRGNNAHADLQAAADAMALAGARELDGGVDAIDRATAAMGNVSNSVSFLGQSVEGARITLAFGGDGGDYAVTFLDGIPASDDTAIDADYLSGHATTDGALAYYVHVVAQSEDLSTLGGILGDVPVGAVAVATSATAACDVTPLFICNPFESEEIDLQQAFADGDLYSRLIRLHPKGSDTASPGNFGFLQVTGHNDNTTASANAIRDIFAGEYNPTCYSQRMVTTKPGAATGIAQGLNVRMDIYEGNMGNAADDYPPDINVRKGFVRRATGPNNACNKGPATDPTWAQAFPDDNTMSPPGDGAAGAFVGSGIWNIDTYWQVNFQTTPPEAVFDAANYPGGALPDGLVPSRYDVYSYEIANNLVDTLSQGNSAAPENGDFKERGTPICSASKTNPAPPEAGRRVIFAAIIDCGAEADNGADDMRVNSYASLFLTRPMLPNSSGDGTIDVEIIDITGWGGNGSLDEFVRDEAILVR
ncbi:pilus assembly protein TadG-related protein [Tabrizicola oligotrophica]|uniref:Putative Flp pilus-assembly TadG-like N-terminal domain-containing protein n=1 Tax=Tabrizicola oligotrophica TaxID=2710650 RepID=A0A6M0QUZ2_9RHOB|nr:pilus assembly protein TadG-related protein [Tabrizicola oligotrophica]NEY91260.1 hypothetical protein [Tabrizicola oligotrophica]